MKKIVLLLILCISSICSVAQINTDRVLRNGRNSLYFEDYVLAIQYFNLVIRSKPYLPDPYYFRAIAKYCLDDYGGAESDCTMALERNPFMTNAYFLRADARQRQEQYEGALADYREGLKEQPNNKMVVLNMAIIETQQKNYDSAEETLNKLLSGHTQFLEGYLVRGMMYQEKGDTIKAFEDYDKAIEIDKYMPNSYSIRGLLYYATHEYDKALADFDEAIKLDPLQTGNYINRGLVKYSKNDLRGAMADYDKVVDLDNNNIIAHFNRGLLRAQVGDNNNAIEDFNVVLSFEPNNYMAYYNRAILKHNISDNKGAIADLDIVLKEYPDFYQGFYFRSMIKRAQNDIAGANQDVDYARAQEQRLVKDIKSGKEQDEKTREKSDKDIDKFNLLVVADKEEESKSKFNSQTRGRVQDRKVNVNPEPRFVISYYEKNIESRQSVHFSQLLDTENRKGIYLRKLRLTNSEAALNEVQIESHFTSISDYSMKIAENPLNANLYLARGIDYMLVQDFESALIDFVKAIELNPNYTLAYFAQAVVLEKQIELKETTDYANKEDLQTNKSQDALQTITAPSLVAPNKLDYDKVLKSYNKVIELDPSFIYAYYNRAGIRFKQQDYKSAILDYNEAIRIANERSNAFAEALYNRGLSRFHMRDYERALDDMRKAGEMGIVEAYSIIKRMTEPSR